MHVRNDEAWPYGEFMQRIDVLRLEKGIRTDAALAELAGVHPTVIGKWRKGLSKPTIESLRSLAIGLGLSPVKVWLWAGLVTRDDLGLPPLPQIYQDAADLDAELPEVERDIQRTHLQYLLDGTRARLRQNGPSNIRRKPISE